MALVQAGNGEFKAAEGFRYMKEFSLMELKKRKSCRRKGKTRSVSVFTGLNADEARPYTIILACATGSLWRVCVCVCLCVCFRLY